MFSRTLRKLRLIAKNRKTGVWSFYVWKYKSMSNIQLINLLTKYKLQPIRKSAFAIEVYIAKLSKSGLKDFMYVKYDYAYLKT